MKNKGQDVTLTNGVTVPWPARQAAAHKLSVLADYARLVYGETIGSTEGPIWDLTGYCHGHERSINPKWTPLLQILEIMDADGAIPMSFQWAAVSLCCQGERLGVYAQEKLDEQG